MKRRNFIGFLGGAVALPHSPRTRSRRRASAVSPCLQPFAIDSPEKYRIEAFVQELQRLGWTDGRNLQIEYRWADQRFRKAAIELVARSPEVILVSCTPAITPLQQSHPKVYRLYLRKSPIRSVPASSPVWRSLAATSPGSRFSTTKLQRNGWNCSRKLLPT